MYQVIKNNKEWRLENDWNLGGEKPKRKNCIQYVTYARAVSQANLQIPTVALLHS